MIGVVNYLDILHHLVSLYPDRLFNYNYSIRELGIGSYAAVWKISEDTPLHEGRFIAVCSPSAPADGDAVHRLRPRHRCRRWLSPLSLTLDSLLGVFQRTDLIKLDFRDMAVFDFPISTFISSVASPPLSHLVPALQLPAGHQRQRVALPPLLHFLSAKYLLVGLRRR